MAALSHVLESALWTAFRSLQEEEALSRRLAAHAAERGNTLSRRQLLEKAEQASRSAVLLRQLLEEPWGAAVTERRSR